MPWGMPLQIQRVLGALFEGISTLTHTFPFLSLHILPLVPSFARVHLAVAPPGTECSRLAPRSVDLARLTTGAVAGFFVRVAGTVSLADDVAAYSEGEPGLIGIIFAWPYVLSFFPYFERSPPRTERLPKHDHRYMIFSFNNLLGTMFISMCSHRRHQERLLHDNGRAASFRKSFTT